jgi:fucose permease
MKFGTVNKDVDRITGHMNSKMKIGIGAVLSLVSAALILYVSTQAEAELIAGLLGAAATLVMALGVLLIGTSESEGRPV